MPPAVYRIVTIPKYNSDPSTESQKNALAQKLREFRLLALKTSPGAFASNYEDEVQRGLDHTMQRLNDTKATHVIAIKDNFACEDRDVHEIRASELTGADWLGTIVLMGPLGDSSSLSAKKDPFLSLASAATSSDPQPRRIDEQPHFHLNGMFVHPSARERGLGGRLLQEALGKAGLLSEHFGGHFVCTIIVDEWNKVATRLYERSGFVVVAREVYGEARLALRMELRR